MKEIDDTVKYMPVPDDLKLLVNDIANYECPAGVWYDGKQQGQQKGESYRSFHGNDQSNMKVLRFLENVMRTKALLQHIFDGFTHLLPKELVTRGVEVDVIWVLHCLQVGRHGREQIVNRDAVFLHDLRRGLVPFDDRRGGLFLRWIIRDRRGGGPDQLCASLLHAFDKLVQPLAIFSDRRISIVDAEVEVNHVPVAVTEPHIQFP